MPKCFVYFFCGLECVAHFVFLRDVWIRIQRAVVASRRATNLATLLPNGLNVIAGGPGGGRVKQEAMDITNSTATNPPTDSEPLNRLGPQDAEECLPGARTIAR